jgi:opacity protein-like surface antigen
MAYRKVLSGVAAAAMMVACGSLAQAADIIEPPPEVCTWCGIYIGGHFGGIASNTEGVYERDDSSSVIDLGAISTIGPMGGGQIGWDFGGGILGGAVFGIVADISFVDLDEERDEAETLTDGDNTEVEFETDFLATVRGRLGWGDEDTLFYVTGGVAFLEGEVSVDDDDCDDNCSTDYSEIGGVVGVGVEWAPWENVGLFVEGLYAFFDEEVSLEDIGTENTDDFFEVEDLLIARVGINFRFGLFQ